MCDTPPQEREIHMTKKRIIILAIVLVFLAIAGISAYAAANYGTSADPLITLSYLNRSVMPDLVSEFQTEIENTLTDAARSGFYELVSLSDGQQLVCDTGCELILRSGTASSTSIGLVDSTSGTSVESGEEILQNHLCIVSNNGGGVLASGAVTILVRGTWTVS